MTRASVALLMGGAVFGCFGAYVWLRRGTTGARALILVLLAGVEYTITPLTDPAFNRRQAQPVRELFAQRMRELPSADFAELLRSAMREDEWLLVLHGAVLGFGAGLIHLGLFGV